MIELTPDDRRPDVWAIVDAHGDISWVDVEGILVEVYITERFAQVIYEHGRVHARPQEEIDRMMARFDATTDKEGITQDVALEAFSQKSPEEMGAKIQGFRVTVVGQHLCVRTGSAKVHSYKSDEEFFEILGL